MSNVMSNMAVLECRDVHKEYHDADKQLKVLMGVNLSVAKGEQLAIMGRSGSGKTTLLQVLGGLDVPSQGEVFINGANVHHLSAGEQERLRNQSLGFIYQFHHLLPEFSALENIAMPLLIANIVPNIALAKAGILLDKVGLTARASHKPAALSGGERQRVAIARALINNPACVLADEPTGNLDDETAESIFDVMRSLTQAFKTSFILVTHDPALAKRLDRTLILHGGQLQPQS